MADATFNLIYRDAGVFNAKQLEDLIKKICDIHDNKCIIESRLTGHSINDAEIIVTFGGLQNFYFIRLR